MIDTTEIDLLTPIGMTLAFYQGYDDIRKQTLLPAFLCQIDFCQTWCDDRYYKNVLFDTSFNDLGFHSRSQRNKKGRACAIILSWSGLK